LRNAATHVAVACASELDAGFVIEGKNIGGLRKMGSKKYWKLKSAPFEFPDGWKELGNLIPRPSVFNQISGLWNND
jgi:hypothetical protein